MDRLENLGVFLNNDARVAVIGGGYAGLAAAVTLAENNIAVTLFESAAECGGRARRVVIRGMDLDNGQHILLGAYKELPRLMKLVGCPADDLLRMPLTLSFPRKFSFRARPFPSPWNVAIGVMLARGISPSARLKTLMFMRHLRRENFQLAEDISVAHWLTHYRQPRSMCAYLWYPLCYAALNTPPDVASAKTFLNVLAQSFNASGDSELLLSRVDLTRLFPERALEFIRQHHGCIRNSGTVKSITQKENAFVLDAPAPTETFSHVICAAAPWQVTRLLNSLPSLNSLCRELDAVGHQPIYTIYFQYPPFVRLPQPMIGMHGGLAQWLFDRGELQHHAGLLAAVISAEGPHQTLSHPQLAQRIHEEIHALFGFPDPLWHQVIAEKRATFSCEVNFSGRSAQTPVKNLFLAGDYLEANWPATLETAARSGVRSAHSVMESFQC